MGIDFQNTCFVEIVPSRLSIQPPLKEVGLGYEDISLLNKPIFLKLASYFHKVLLLEAGISIVLLLPFSVLVHLIR